jgi:CRISPR-associated protein Csm4
MALYIYHLNFPHGLHIAESGFGQEAARNYICSDTLYSAIITAASILYGNDAAEELIQNQEYTLSSAFPYKGSNYYVPYHAANGGKGIQYNLNDHIIPHLKGNSKTLEIKGEPLDFQIFSDRSRVALDRQSNASQVYNMQELYFAPDAGLYFFMESINPQIEQKIHACISFLADEGIGSEKSIGKGIFSFERRQISPLMPSTPAHKWLILSMYSPSAAEKQLLLPEQSAYGITIRGGWIKSALQQSNLRKKRCRVITEGSILHFAQPCKPIGNQFTMLSKGLLPHNVYRIFRPFALPFY